MRITQTRDHLLKKVLLGSVAAIPFVLISCSNSEVSGPAETSDPQAVVLTEADPPAGNVQFGKLHLREDGSKELHFVRKDGSEGVVEFTGEHTVTDGDLHTIKTRLDENDEMVVDWTMDLQETDEKPHTVHLEIISEAGDE